MVLDRIQAHLEAVYGLTCELRASDYLVDEEQAMRLGATGRAKEELLLAEGDGVLELALYVAPQVLTPIEPLSHAHAVEHQLPKFCEATEGVSHFMYVQRAASLERKVSLLEMEAQAEVDKFVACSFASWSEGLKLAHELARRLFDDVAYLPTLNEDERWRYEEANRLAKAYCQRLLRLMASRRVEVLLAELRHSYRMGAEAKLSYFAASR